MSKLKSVLTTGNQDLYVTVATRAFADHLWWKLNLYAMYILYAPLTLRITQAFGSYTSIGVQNEHLAACLAVVEFWKSNTAVYTGNALSFL
jgi:hypothetical protein